MVLYIVDEETLADVLLHLPRHPHIIVDGADKYEYYFIDTDRAREFLIWAFRNFVKKKGARILVFDEGA